MSIIDGKSQMESSRGTVIQVLMQWASIKWPINSMHFSLRKKGDHQKSPRAQNGMQVRDRVKLHQ